MPIWLVGVPSGTMETVLVTGGTGYLGQRLLPLVAERAHVVATARNPRALSRLYHPEAMDLCDKQSVFDRVLATQPQAIIHAAAINPGVDDALMQTVNELGTQYLAQAANEVGCRLVMVSTDMVHDGNNAPYADDAAPSPINDYGRSKADGERVAFEAHSNCVAVRTSLIYGLDAIDRGTAGFAERLAQGNTLTLFDDVLRQPVWRDSLAISLLLLALDLPNETGVVNVTGSDVLDRATFGEMMLNFWQIPYSTENVKRIQAAHRPELEGVPLNTEMSLARAHKLGLPTPGVQEVLAQLS